MRKKILLDMDGVLVDFAKGVFDLTGLPRPERLWWDFVPNESWALMGYDFWAGLDPYPEFTRIVEAAEEKVGPDNVALLSSPIETRGCLEGKKEWVRKHLPEYQRRLILAPCKEFCARPQSILVDDYEGNIQKFTQAGGWGILVPREWNMLYHQHDWLDATLKEIRAIE